MSLQDLFQKNISSANSADSGSSKVESYDFTISKNEKNNKFEPRIDFSSASNFSFYGSAKLYYEKAIERIHNNYPYDGSRLEKLQFHMSSSQLEEWLYKNLYPKTNGYINLSYGGWGTQSSITNGYGLPTDIEYIYARGGMHTASGGMIGKELFKTFDKSVKYDENNNRTTNFRMNVPDGFTVEFWLKKEAFDISKTEKEVVLDLWNGQVSSSSDYGRFTLELTSSGESDGSDTFLVTLQSGTVGFFQQPIGNSAVTTGSLEDWHHYAFSFTSNSSGVDSRIYVDGNLNEKVSLGTQGVDEIGGLINGYLGALQTNPSSSEGSATGAKYSGKLSASLDEFRFWKTRRTSEQIATYWNQSVGAGANTDIANKNLGIYYKFNEGIVGNDLQDSVVLDYSGRIANGSWTGYSQGSRNTGSAMVSSSAAVSEELDPIIYSAHPDVVTLKQNLQASGSLRDDENGNILINRFPNWLVEEDESINNNFRYLTQIISSFLDELYLEITELKKLKFADYYSTEYKPIPFADRLIIERGIDAKDILKIATTLEKYEQRNIDTKFLENDINDIKNIIYQNIYNNLPKILKSKGTERSFRNMLRCFGFDDEIVKLNIYTNQGTHYFTDKYKVTSRNKKVIDFGNSNAFSSIVFQTSSVGNSRTYIYGSDSSKQEQYNALTFEINALMPYKAPSNEDSYVYYGQFTSSIGGFHQARSDSADFTFDGSNLASLQIFAIRDKIDSKHVKFMLKSHDGSLQLTSSLFFDVYDNNLWTLAARVKPIGYPFYGSYSSENQEYIVDFYGVRHKAGDVEDYFHVSSSVTYASGSSFLSNRKRVFVGANCQNFTGSVLQKSDVKISNCRFYLDYLENSVLNEHNKDVTIHGSNKTFEGNTAFGTDLENARISSLETVALNWDFNKVTGSDSSGEFIVQDISSGSTDTIYGWIDNITRREHRGLGYNFEASDNNLVSNEFLTLYKKELPEISYTADNITIAGLEEEAFLVDKEVSDAFYVLEKSMYQVISEKMLESLSSTSEMSNLFGKAIDRYRLNYKNLDYARRIFFDKVEEDPDFDKFTEYFRWIDNTIFNYVKDLIPASANFVENISDIVESHIFERNKVRTLLPNKFVSPVPDDHISSIRELKYNWKFGHAPLSGDDNDNCLWQKERQVRTDIAARETIRKVIVNDNNQEAKTFVDNDGNTYEGSTYALRRLTRPYKESVSMVQSLHGGINYQIQKNRRISKNVVETHSKLSSVGTPINVLLVGAGAGQGIELKNECNDIEDPNYKEKYDVKAFLGKFASGESGGVFTPIDDTTTFNFGLKGAFALPFNIYSASVPSGYNKKFDEGWKQGAYITNVHSDTANNKNDIPMQGPFTERWVGGHQSRHQDINRYDTSLVDGESLSAPPNNLHNIYTRPEGYRILLFEAGGSSDGAIGMVDAQYGVTAISGHPNAGSYPDVAKKKAVFFREETTKRPVNIKNIQTTTASYSHGNYRKQYEIISVASGKQHNNPLFRSNAETHQYLPSAIENVLPKTTNYHTLIGVSDHPSGNVFGVGESNILNNTVEIYSDTPGTFSSITFDLDQPALISHGSTLQLTGGATNYIVESRDPNSTTTKTSIPDKILYTGSFGLSFHSTGSDDNAQAISNATITEIGTNNFSVSFWFYSNDYSGGGSNTQIVFYDGVNSKHRIFAGNDDIRVRIYNNASAFANSDFNTNTRSDDEEWHHYVVAFEVSDLSQPAKLWKDGVELSEIGGYTGPAQSIVNIDKIEILVDDENGFQDIVLWDKLLTQADVDLIYASGSWCNPATHPSSSNIVDWWKFGYEDYWSGLGFGDGDTINNFGSAPYTISSSFGTGGNDLEIGSDDDEHMIFRTGNNPFGSSKSNTVYFNELSSSLSSSFDNFTVSYTGTPATFTMTANATGSTAVNGSITGTDFSNLATTAGTERTIDYEDGYINVTSRTTGSVQKSVFSTRFSAPGGIETMTYGFLDAHNQEMSVYNALPYRNLLLRKSGSGESGTIRLDDHLGKRHGLITHLSRHSGKFGADSVYGSITAANYVTTPSYHKIPRNTARKPASNSSLANPTFNEDHDNFFVRSTLPRSDFQYSWITSSLGHNYSINSGKQRMFGYAPRDGILSSSYEVHDESGYVPAITFPTASELFGE